jgi:hypothetical protein
MSSKDCAAFVEIDWADQEHASCLIDPKTQLLEQGRIKQRFPGQKVAVCLEQKRGALMYALMKFECLPLTRPTAATKKLLLCSLVLVPCES